MSGGFGPDWLAARDRYDRAALDREAVSQLAAWALRQPTDRPLRVVDLGCGTGAGLRRALGWLAGRPVDAYAVDDDERLLARLAVTPTDSGPAHGTPAVTPIGGSSSAPMAESGAGALAVTPVRADLLAPLDPAGGPLDGAVDLVVAHAVADLFPLDRFAERVAALLRPGGCAHVALTYDGNTAFSPTDDPDLDRRILDAYHRHMDRARARWPTYGGSTAGRRVAEALADAGLRVVSSAPSTWDVRATDGPAGRAVLDGLIGFVVGSLSELGVPPAGELARWRQSRHAALAAGVLRARIRHVDVLAIRPDMTVSSRAASVR